MRESLRNCFKCKFSYRFNHANCARCTCSHNVHNSFEYAIDNHTLSRNINIECHPYMHCACSVHFHMLLLVFSFLWLYRLIRLHSHRALLFPSLSADSLTLVRSLAPTCRLCCFCFVSFIFVSFIYTHLLRCIFIFVS